MKKLLITAALFAATSVPALADLTSDLTTIYAGQSITFNYTLPPGSIAPPTMYGPFPDGPGYTTTETVSLQFIGSVFQSGDSQTQLIGGTGPVKFTYLTPGDYTASVSVTIFYGETLCTFQGSTSVGCLNTSGNAPPGYPTYLNSTENITVLAAVPEPSTWAMMLLGFAGLGFVFGRSRSKLFA